MYGGDMIGGDMTLETDVEMLTAFYIRMTTNLSYLFSFLFLFLFLFLSFSLDILSHLLY